MFWGTGELINPLAAVGLSDLPDVLEKIESLSKTEEEMQKDDMKEVEESVDKIMAKLGMSLDFGNGGSFHAYAEVKLDAANNKIQGKGQLDMLIDPSGGKWHMYIGGYDSPEIEVPSFFDPSTNITLYPITVGLELAGVEVVAKTYFLLGNDIVGPPDINAAAASFFDISTNSNAENREILNCGGANPATGTGIAFGASLTAELNKKVQKRIFGKKVTILNVQAKGGAGFDVALLRYENGSVCGLTGQTPHGANYFRASGNVWAYISAKGKVLGIRLPTIGMGVLLRADIPDPNYFQVLAVLKFKGTWKFDFEIGERCGVPGSGQCTTIN